MNRSCRAAEVLCLCAAVALFAGCGVREYRLPETGASLEGTVKYQSSPLPAAMIIVAGESSSATGNIGADGRYKIDNVPLGEVKLAVNTDAAKGQMIGQRMAQSYQAEKGGSGQATLQVVDVPKKYQDPHASGITTTIKEGANTFDIVLD